MPTLHTYNSGQWVQRDSINVELSGSFQQANAMYLYKNGSFKAIFAPEFQHKGAGTADDDANAYGSGVY